MNVVTELEVDVLDGDEEVDKDSLGWLLLTLVAVADEVAVVVFVEWLVKGDEFLLDKVCEESGEELSLVNFDKPKVFY